MQAYLGDPVLKERLIADMAGHRQLERLVQGTGWEDDRGCFIGCLFRAYDHDLAPERIALASAKGAE